MSAPAPTIPAVVPVPVGEEVLDELENLVIPDRIVASSAAVRARLTALLTAVSLGQAGPAQSAQAAMLLRMVV